MRFSLILKLGILVRYNIVENIYETIKGHKNLWCYQKLCLLRHLREKRSELFTLMGVISHVTLLINAIKIDYIRMMTSSKMETFSALLALCEGNPGHRWIPLSKARDAELWNSSVRTCHGVTFVMNVGENCLSVLHCNYKEVRLHRHACTITP